MNLNPAKGSLLLSKSNVSIPIRDLMNLNRPRRKGRRWVAIVSIPIRDLMNLNLHVAQGGFVQSCFNPY